MIVVNYAGKEKRLSKAIIDSGIEISYGNLQKLLRKKDIKVNGKRVSDDVVLYGGEKLEIYATDEMLAGAKRLKIKVAYEDNNVIIVDKPQGVEVLSNSKNDSLEDLLRTKTQNQSIKAVHRIDRNTKGLVIFSKNVLAEKELLSAFKNHEIKKYYHAMVVGDIRPETDTLVAYLKTDKEKSYSFVSSKPLDGYSKIITKYKVIGEYGDSTLLEVELVTGKTHQIRAHFAHIGHPLIGDGKYGKNTDNRKFKEKSQMLIAKKIVFDFKPNSKLYYLNGKNIVSHQELV